MKLIFSLVRVRANFKEENDRKLLRERFLHRWPYESPTPHEMFCAGWVYYPSTEVNFTKCFYCDATYSNWQFGDNPSNIHKRLSPNCPFICTLNPMHPSLITTKPVADVFPSENLAHDAANPNSKIILPSNSRYSLPPTRAESFNIYPGGAPPNIEALVASGFYYTGRGRYLVCYHCDGRIYDFHEIPPNGVDAAHRHRFPACRFAQLLLPKNAIRYPSNFFFLN